MKTASYAYHVRDLLDLPDEEIKKLPIEHSITFDNGISVESTRNATIYSHYFWSIFRSYRDVRILPVHHVLTVLRGRALDASTHLKLCTQILKSTVTDMGLFLPIQKEPLLELIMKTISDVMGKLSVDTEENVTSIDILDFIEITHHEKIKALREQCYLDPRRIKYAYDETIKIIETEACFHDNGLAKAVRAKMVKANQVTQCVGFRGYCTEVDGSIFRKPNWSNYVSGNRNLYDFVADSRTAAKSHYYADTALKDSEYMARKFQLFATIVEHIVYEDCKSDKHMHWIVGGEKKDSSGTVIYPGDLEFLIGKYYLQEGDTEYKCIEGNEKHLIGKPIKYRSVLYCKTPNPHHVCHVCTGKLSENISRFANIGHLGSVSTTKDLTQSILSIKHVNTSSTMIKIMLMEHELKFMNTGVDGTAFYLNAEVKKMSPYLTVARDEVPGLVDLDLIDDIDRVSLQRISQTNKVNLTVMSNGREIEVQLNVSQKLKPSMMSRELLCYLKVHGWKTNDQNDFIFDMQAWDPTWPLFVMPNKEESFVDLAAAVDTLVRSSQKMIQKRLAKDAPAILLQELFDLVNSKMRTNILSFEIIVYALMVESTTSYGMARGAVDPVLGLGEPLTKFRSLGQAMAYQSQSETITNPANFFKGRRPDSPMDVFLAPKEVVAAYPGQ